MKKAAIYLLLSLLTLQVTSQNIGISSNGSNPNSSAMLDIDVSGLATKKGLLIPRVTAAQKTAMNPLLEAAQGLMVYQTDGVEGYYYNTSTTTIPVWKFLLPSTGNNGGWGLNGNSNTTAGTNFIGTADANDLVLKSNGAERMRFLVNGNTGLGTTFPAYKFDINHSSSLLHDRALNLKFTSSATGTSDSTSGLFIRSTATSSGDIVGATLSTKANGTGNSAGIFNIVTGTGSGGVIGISTILSGAGNGVAYGANITNSSMWADNYGGYYQISGGRTNTGIYADVAAGTNESYGIHITGSPMFSAYFDGGEVFIKDKISIGYLTSPMSSYTLDLNGSMNITGVLSLNQVPGNPGEILQSNGANSAPTWIDPLTYSFGMWTADGFGDISNTNTGFVGINCFAPTEQLSVDGNIIATGNIIANDGFACASDRRYKKDIAPLTHSLQNVLKLNGVSYNWKISEFPERNFIDEEQIGFIAQDIEAVYPHVVFTDSKGFKSIDYSRLTPILVEAIKELNLKVEKLEKELEKEKSSSSSLESILKRLQLLETNLETTSSIEK